MSQNRSNAVTRYSITYGSPTPWWHVHRWHTDKQDDDYIYERCRCGTRRARYVGAARQGMPIDAIWIARDGAMPVERQQLNAINDALREHSTQE